MRRDVTSSARVRAMARSDQLMGACVRRTVNER
jgi:hypothetical protein